MRLVRHLSDLPHSALANGSVVTIGAFDGLHLGHQELLDAVIERSKSSGLPSVVMSFEPTPREFFSGNHPPARLMRFREKFESLEQYGIDVFFCPRFSREMRAITADAFVRKILVHGLNTRQIIVGDDFRFASRREGSIDTLRRCQAALQFEIQQIPSLRVDGVRVSSTAIRQALGGGNVPLATAMLGRPYRMSGRIVKGRQVGRTLGYSTANVDLRRRQSAVMGIYAVRVEGLPEGPLNGVASVGTRPTFNLTKPLLEVHLFDFDRDIYGAYIHVDFIAHLRDEVKFDSVDDLIAQMHQDAENARSILAANAA